VTSSLLLRRFTPSLAAAPRPVGGVGLAREIPVG
jgi:hypothetical protein